MSSVRFAPVIALTIVLSVMLPLPMFLRTVGPIALRCDHSRIVALFLSQKSCRAAPASGSSCVCLPIGQSIGYTSLPLYLQIAEVVVAAIVWALVSSGPRRLLWLNAAGIFVVLVYGVIIPLWVGGWALLAVLYAPMVAAAYCVLATFCFVVTTRVVARTHRARSRGS